MPLQSTGLFAACPILPQCLLHIVPVHLLQQAACCVEVCCDALFELRHRPAAITVIIFTSCQLCLGLVAVDTSTTASLKQRRVVSTHTSIGLSASIHLGVSLSMLRLWRDSVYMSWYFGMDELRLRMDPCDCPCVKDARNLERWPPHLQPQPHDEHAHHVFLQGPCPAVQSMHGACGGASF